MLTREEEGDGDGLRVVSFAESSLKDQEDQEFQQQSFEESSFFQHGGDDFYNNPHQTTFLNQSTTGEGFTCKELNINKLTCIVTLFNCMNYELFSCGSITQCICCFYW